MIKDIPILKVGELAFAVVPRMVYEEDHEDFWDTYLLNLKTEPIFSVIVNSRGYGEIEGQPRKTTTLRYFWDRIEPMTAVKVEPVEKAVFALANEYWVSFSFQDYLYDKQYVFVPGSLDEIHFSDIPLLNRKGVMIR
ncbi:MAG: hypothetical protein JNJ90_08475 [Saprospiraceae bacterium]|jgi:hypothetical protein|nr:hypothetical protein [Saprospiraceae bacterium]